MTDRIDLAGKRILVTGGTTGIGLATVAQLVRQGARVLTFGRHQDSLDNALEQARSGPGTVDGIVADAATKEGIDTVFEHMDETLGGIDILVTSAALGAQPVHEMEEDSWRYVVETNLIGTLASARRAILRMDAQGGGTCCSSDRSVPRSRRSARAFMPRPRQAYKRSRKRFARRSRKKTSRSA